MKPKSLFSGIKQKIVTFGEHQGKNPLFMQNFHVMGGHFLADAEAVKHILPKGVSCYTFFPGKTLLGVHAIEYKHSDIGPYHEVSFSIPVRDSHLKMKKWLKNPFGLSNYILSLPVSTDISCEGGIQFFHLPKFKADITFRETKTHRICTVRDHGTLDLIVEIDAKKIHASKTKLLNFLPPLSVNLLAKDLSKTRHNRFLIRPKAISYSLLLPKISLRFGKHPLADEMRSLKIGAQMFYLFAPHCEGILYPSESL